MCSTCQFWPSAMVVFKVSLFIPIFLSPCMLQRTWVDEGALLGFTIILAEVTVCPRITCPALPVATQWQWWASCLSRKCIYHNQPTLASFYLIRATGLQKIPGGLTFGSSGSTHSEIAAPSQEDACHGTFQFLTLTVAILRWYPFSQIPQCSWTLINIGGTPARQLVIL